LNSVLKYDTSGVFLVSYFDNKGTQTISNGTGVLPEVNEADKLLSRTTYSNGVPDGIFEAFFSKGNIQTSGQYKYGVKDGRWSEFFSNGKLRKTTTYSQGLVTGPYEEYFDNGKLYVKGTFDNGKKIGNWEWYRENGVKDMEGNILVNEACYNLKSRALLHCDSSILSSVRFREVCVLDTGCYTKSISCEFNMFLFVIDASHSSGSY
jgi:antitoxin component YwqK of YwqJK toxin-antitoxin module